MNKFLYFTLPLAALMVSCTAETVITPDEDKTAGLVPDVPVITAILPGANEETKLSFDYTNWCLKASWTAGDNISIVPDGIFFSEAGIYTLPTGGGTSAEFVQTSPITGTGDSYTAFFPGSRLKCMADLTHWTYDGQIQTKSDPMAHLTDYFLMYKEIAAVGTVDFSDAVMSSCLCVNLSGKSFNTPTMVRVRIIGNGQFAMNDGLSSGYRYITNSPDHAPFNKEYGRAISVDLKGYNSSESSIQAWIAMASDDINLSEGDIVRVMVECADGNWFSDFTLDANMTLTGGKCHTLSLDSGWKQSNADYTHYDFDGELVTVQAPGRGLNLVIMGDGFIGDDFSGGDSSTYMKAMQDAVEQFFDLQPYTYLRDYFDVHIIKVVSPERTNAETTGLNGARNTGTETTLSVQFTPNSTSVKGDDATVRKYAKAVLGDSLLRNATFMVIANQACRAGTCYMYYSYDSFSFDYANFAQSIAYFGLGTHPAERAYLVQHEAGGHGFGKLSDEYSYSSHQFGSEKDWSRNLGIDRYGFYRNADCYVDEDIQAIVGTSYPLTDKTNVKWADMFDTANDYETVESLDIYEGASVYETGFCRSTPNSIMNHEGLFNAVSRRAIMYRAKCLMGELATNSDDKYGSDSELNSFLEWDAAVGIPAFVASSSAPALAPRNNCVEQYRIPLPPPVVRFGHWEGDIFVEE